MIAEYLLAATLVMSDPLPASATPHDLSATIVNDLSYVVPEAIIIEAALDPKTKSYIVLVVVPNETQDQHEHLASYLHYWLGDTSIHLHLQHTNEA